MKDLNRQGWMDDEVSIDLGSQQWSESNSSAKMSEQELLDEEVSEAPAEAKEAKEDSVIGLRRKSCTCTGCAGNIKRPPLKGNIIVLDEELQILRDFHAQLK